MIKSLLKRSLVATVVALGCLQLSGCTPGHNTMGATGTGAVAGGLIGSAIFGNSAAGIIGGALIGGIVGNQVGQYMDRQDRQNMHSAIVNTRMGNQVSWTNRKRGVTYTVRPVKVYRTKRHRYCREYQTTVRVAGKKHQAYGTACRQPDGSWKIVK